MPEYLAPGVYIEETSFRAKSIEGVSTSTAGFVGPTRFGPVGGLPELLTSFAEFERIYGSLDQLEFTGESAPSHNYLAHAVRAFFENGGRRLYVARAYKAKAESATGAGDGDDGVASYEINTSPPQTWIRARFPGQAGKVRVTFAVRVGENALAGVPQASGKSTVLRGVSQYDLVWVNDETSPPSSPPTSGKLFWAERYLKGNMITWRFKREGSGSIELDALDPDVDTVRVVTINVTVAYPGPTDRPAQANRSETWTDLSTHPSHARAFSRVFADQPSSRRQALEVPIIIEALSSDGVLTAEHLLKQDAFPTDLLRRTLQPGTLKLSIGETLDATDPNSRNRIYGDAERQFTIELAGGGDGVRPGADEYEGDDSDPKNKSGLKSFEDIADISIAAAPGSSYATDDAQKPIARQIMGHLISHCERMRYRIAVLDALNNQTISEVRQTRAQIDSTHAALYYPWVRVMDPVTDKEIDLPPSGFVAGIYARNDIEKGVHKAPANEVVRGAISFEVMLNKSQQDVLNPDGINCFRYFEGRGYRLWGARTISSDPEWKYVNLRRYFAYLERSIERGTQWVVFENNSDPLWANVRRTVEDFLFNEWKSGHLMGLKPEQAYFVRCDRSTMTQNDFDNGRLICLIGVAPVRPAEFVIFRIGQWTGDRQA